MVGTQEGRLAGGEAGRAAHVDGADGELLARTIAKLGASLQEAHKHSFAKQLFARRATRN